MKNMIMEFIWILLCLLALSLLPWWQAVVIAAALSPFMLRLTEWGFRRRIIFLFVVFSIFLMIFHLARPEISTAISRLLKLPHYSLLALLSAGTFAVVFALAAEAPLWMKFSFRRAKLKFNGKN